MVRVKAELVTGRDLRPGDLFSTAGPEYWDKALDRFSVGESVYIRTNTKADLYDDAELPVYRITIEED